MVAVQMCFVELVKDGVKFLSAKQKAFGIVDYPQNSQDILQFISTDKDDKVITVIYIIPYNLH